MKTKTDYERLPEVVSGFPVGIPDISAKLVKRTDRKAMYYRWDNVWEVFRISISEAAEIYGRKYPRREVYPGNEDFGSTAWCFSDEESALKMYDNLPE